MPPDDLGAEAAGAAGAAGPGAGAAVLAGAGEAFGAAPAPLADCSVE